MRTIPALFAATLLTACGGAETGTVSGENGEEASYTVDREGDEVEIRATDADGEEVVINAGEGAGNALPLGFTVYPGAAVVSNSTIATNDGEGSVLYFTTSASPQDVTAYYRRQAQAAGIAIGMETTSNGARTIAGEGGDGKSFMMTATTIEEGTGVQMMIGQKPGG